MDPFLLGALSNEVRLMQANIAAGRLEAEKQAEQERLHQWKREVITEVSAEAANVVREISQKPLPSFVKVCLYLHDLEIDEIVPDAFEDMQEKEDAILLWRKLENLHKTLRSNLTEDQIEVCQKCLNAIGMRRFIKFIDPYVRASEEFDKVELEWKAAHKRLKEVKQKETKILVGIGAANVVTFGIACFLKGLEAAAPYLILWVMCTVFICIALWVWLDSRRPKNIKGIDCKYNQLYEQAGIDNDQLWENIEEAFDGIPTQDDLVKRWKEQEPAINAVFQE